MIQQAIETGIATPDIIHESLIAMKRAGADMIISYFALAYANWMKHQT